MTLVVLTVGRTILATLLSFNYSLDTYWPSSGVKKGNLAVLWHISITFSRTAVIVFGPQYH